MNLNDLSQQYHWLFSLSTIALCALYWRLSRHSQKREGERQATAAREGQEKSVLTSQLDHANQRLLELKEQNAALDKKNLDLAKKEALIDSKSEQLAVEQASVRSLTEELKELRDKLRAADHQVASLSAQNREVVKAAEETRASSALNKDLMLTSFESLAQKVFEEKTSTLKDQNDTQLQTLLTPLSVRIADFTKKVDDNQVDQTKERASLREELKHLRDLNQKLSQDAKNLVHALKGNQKTQGNWGEVILEKILESSGLTKNREYETQASLKADSGKRFQPDVIVHLPEDKHVIIDAKV